MLEDWSVDGLAAAIKQVQVNTGIKGKPLFMGIRVAVTTSLHGPDLKNSILMIGKEETLKRVNQCLNA